jgi:hypothetical protein
MSSGARDALRRANPRHQAGFTESVRAATELATARIRATPDRALRHGVRHRPLLRLSLAASLVAAAVVAAFLAVASPSGGPGVENAVAAVQRAATVTAESAELSGTAVVRITRDGEPWGTTTIRWNGADISIVHPSRSGGGMRVVDGVLYGPGPDGWLELGSPQSIDPDSGTTPDEYLAAVREDVGGTTLRRITAAMTGLVTSHLDDGSAVYAGTVAAGRLARETGFKEGQHIRVLPFGYVAQDEAADASSPLDTAITVGPDGIFRQISVSWGGASEWTYTVSYAGLGSTPEIEAPSARSLLEQRRADLASSE